MCSVGYEPTIPAFERAKAVHVLDRTATVINRSIYIRRIFSDYYVRSDCLHVEWKLIFLQKTFAR
jgi:hypothetical protein